MMSTLIIISISAAFFALTAFSLLRWIFIGQEQNLSQRLVEISTVKNIRNPEIPVIIRQVDLSQIPLLNRFLEKLRVSKNLQRLIEQANLSVKVGELVLLMLVLGGISLLLTQRSGNIILIGGCFALFSSLPILYVLYRRSKRLKLFEEQFPGALDMMSNATQAGFALNRAIQVVAEEEADPIAMEFKKLFEEMNLGLPVKDALMNLTQRIDSVDLKLFVTGALIQRESGGNLSEMLTKMSSTIRARVTLLGQVKVLTTQGRFSAWILGTLPLALGCLVSILNPDYIGLLVRETLGHIMITIGLTLQMLGFIIIRKIVRIKIQ